MGPPPAAGFPSVSASCHASTVDIEVSSVLTVGQAYDVGQAYELRNVQHLLTGPVLTGVYDGRPRRVHLDDTQVTPPIGHALTPAARRAPFQPEQLRQQPRMIQQLDTSAVDQRQELPIERDLRCSVAQRRGLVARDSRARVLRSVRLPPSLKLRRTS